MHRLGTAGWSLPLKPKDAGSHLYHYSRTLRCVEINSTFYRPHRAATWMRWAAETPADFRFAIKAPKTISHEAKLRDTAPLLTAFMEQIKPIAEKAGPILFQLPPSLAFEAGAAEEFLALLRTSYGGDVVLEPREASWFTAEADALLKQYTITRVAADPPKGAAAAARPGGSASLVYYRLHGSPRTYYSSYDGLFLKSVADKIKGHRDAWVIFDNTALGEAYPNAMSLQTLLGGS